MSGFSGVVQISNISDYIEPGQKCILPEERSISTEIKQKLVNIHSKKANKISKKTVKLTLNDCLACSGCITTAETMLIESQTINQMLKGLSDSKLSVVTVSPQSLCSIAVYFGESPHKSAKRLSHFFEARGAAYIIDSSFGRLISQKLLYEEFREKYFQKNNLNRKTLLTGTCPGFVCYAEKTHGNLLVPLISRVKSPQAITGILIKDFLRRKLEIKNTSDIFHVCVMPCYDKKLEASRSDFIINECNDVDCVVTASELIDLLKANNQPDEYSAFCSLPDDFYYDWLSSFKIGHIIGDNNRETSGGFANYVVQRLLADFPNANVESTKKNKDLEEIKIHSVNEFSDPIIIAKLYGFRNIQNAVQKLKQNKLHLDFIEIMACPSGCSNGGGQIRGINSDERLNISNSIFESYFQLHVDRSTLETHLDQLFKEWFTLNPNYNTLFTTDYHALANKNILNPLQSW